MALGCDTATIVTSARLTTLKNAGMKFVGRYLNYLSGYHDKLTSEEVSRISNAGLYIVSIYQNYGTNKASYFTASNGVVDAKDAISLAKSLGQPKNTPIYFAVDFDALDSELKSNIVPYFQSVLGTLKRQDMPYRLGIYGSKKVCAYIRGTYEATDRYTFVVDNSWAGQFTDWNLRQYNFNKSLGSGNGKIVVDYNESSSHGGGGWKL